MNTTIGLMFFIGIKIRGVLFIAEVLDYHHYKQECPRICRERSAFLCSEAKLSRFQQYLKAKTLLSYVFVNVLSLFQRYLCLYQ